MPTAKGKRPATGKKSAASGKKRAPARSRKNDQQLLTSAMVGVLVFGAGLLLLLTLFSSSNATVLLFIRSEMNAWFGQLRHVAMILVCVLGLQIAFGDRWPVHKGAIVVLALIVCCIATLLQVFRMDDINKMLSSVGLSSTYNNFLWKSYDASKLPFGGGFVGALLGYPLGKYLDVLGSVLLLFFVIGALGMLLVRMVVPGAGERMSGWFGSIMDDMGEWRQERRTELEARRAAEKKDQEARRAAESRDQSLLVPVPKELFEVEEEAEAEPARKPAVAKGRPATASKAKKAPARPAPVPRERPKPRQEEVQPEEAYYEAPSAPSSKPAGRKQPPVPQPSKRPKARLYIEDILPESEAGGRAASRAVEAGTEEYLAPAHPSVEREPDVVPDFLAKRRAQYDEAYGAFESMIQAKPTETDGLDDALDDDYLGDIPDPIKDLAEEVDLDLLDPESSADTPWEAIGDSYEIEENPAPPVRRRRVRQQNPLDYQPKLDSETRLDRPDWKPEEPEPAPAMEIEEIEEYRQPPFSLLVQDMNGNSVDTRVQDAENAQKLEETLLSFGVDARVIKVVHGPAVTRYELQPAPGVKVSKIVNLTDDIALNMAAMGVRIEAPIPGKAAIGIEIANDDIATVQLRDVLESDESIRHPSKLAVALGKDIAGKRIIADLARMPHLLIAGATGSGKSVCINTLITSIIYRATPEEVRLILIDPKKVELSMYNGIPHLLVPVVTDPKKASGALSWAVMEMDERYRLFADIGVRDIRGYNARREADTPLMPQIVVIIDELSDLMLVAPGEVEDYICRIAQLARACGIHLVIATQRPSVNVITGIIKANIPSRIAFAVSSQVDSRTILDTAGAEKLLGKGDMLYAPSGGGKPMRVQGCFVSDKEVSRVTEYVKDRHTTDYSQAVIDALNSANEEESAADEDASDSSGDQLFEQAVEIAVESGQASISMLQRRLRIGYARAGRLIDDMARKNIISQADGAKPRDVLITREDMQLLFKKG